MKKSENKVSGKGRDEKPKDLLAQREQLGLELDEEYIHLAKVILETTEKHGQKINRLVDRMVLTNQQLEHVKAQKRKSDPKDGSHPDT